MINCQAGEKSMIVLHKDLVKVIVLVKVLVLVSCQTLTFNFQLLTIKFRIFAHIF